MGITDIEAARSFEKAWNYLGPGVSALLFHHLPRMLAETSIAWQVARGIEGRLVRTVEDGSDLPLAEGWVVRLGPEETLALVDHQGNLRFPNPHPDSRQKIVELQNPLSP